jgi:hypothetical protein
LPVFVGFFIFISVVLPLAIASLNAVIYHRKIEIK